MAEGAFPATQRLLSTTGTMGNDLMDRNPPRGISLTPVAGLHLRRTVAAAIRSYQSESGTQSAVMKITLPIGLSGLLSIALLLLVASTVGVFAMAGGGVSTAASATDEVVESGASRSNGEMSGTLAAAPPPTPTMVAVGPSTETAPTAPTDEIVLVMTSAPPANAGPIEDAAADAQAAPVAKALELGAQETPLSIGAPTADIVLSATLYQGTGGVVVFALVLTNQSPIAGTDIAVQSAPPAGLHYAGHVAAQGDYDPQTGVWSVGDVPGGAELTLHITATSEPPASEPQAGLAPSEGATVH